MHGQAWRACRIQSDEQERSRCSMYSSPREVSLSAHELFIVSWEPQEVIFK
jgi:hypothetical protein